MAIEGVINVSIDSSGNQTIHSPYEETAARADKIALYTKALDYMEGLRVEAFQAGRIKPGLHFDTSDFKPFTIPFRVISDSSTGAEFEVEFIKKDYDVLEILFGGMYLKEKRKDVRRKPKA